MPDNGLRESAGTTHAFQHGKKWLLETYDRCKRWAAFGFVLGGFLSVYLEDKYRFIPLTALLGIVAQTLFELVRLTKDPTLVPKARFVERVAAVLPYIIECVESLRKRGEEIQIRWIGVTMTDVWSTTLEMVLVKLAAEKVANVSVHIASIDPKWLSENCVNPEWTAGGAEASRDRIRKYFAQPELSKLQWKLTINPYQHMPMIHGGTIGTRSDTQCLVLGISSWNDGRLRAGKKSCEVHLADDGEYFYNRLAVFDGWFAFCTGARDEWYQKNNETPAPLQSSNQTEESSFTSQLR